MLTETMDKIIGRGKKYSDFAFAFLFILIILMMVIPLPPVIVDFLLSCNITLAVMVLLTTSYIVNPLQFSVFPSLLLFATLFRLALNVSTTRLILLHGYAGRVISAFGSFVVGGNYVVGFIIFLILVIIQFVVITNGASRIAEVAARFTLDAMPGKQMSIDADLNAGLIDDQEARKRRREIERQADFYGAMDGASKFVRGDAIAGLIITLINFLGGIIVGSLQRGLPVQDALEVYALLTVGDGLVAQIPALLISTSSGLIVTRAASEENLGQDVTREITQIPRALLLTGFLLLVFALLPGLPKIPFLLLALGSGVLAYIQRGAIEKKDKAKEEVEQKTKEELPRTSEDIAQLIEVDPIELEIGYGLIPLVDGQSGGDLLHRITQMRINLAQEKGFVVPPIRVRDNLQLRPNQYRIKIRGAEVAEGEIMPHHYLAIGAQGEEASIEGVPTREPAFNLPAYWVNEVQKENAELAGFTLVDAESVLVTHLSEIVKSHAHELITRQDVQLLLEQVKRNNQAVVEELVPNLMGVGEIQKVLQYLLLEQVPIRDLSLILETLADFAPQTKSVEELTEMVRRKLGRSIVRQYLENDGKLHILTLDAQLENTLAEVFSGGETLDPSFFRQLLDHLGKNIERIVSLGHFPIVLTTGKIRRTFRNLVVSYLPQVVVLAFEEIPREVEVKVEGMVPQVGSGEKR
ncbi:MAG: flagellar biosynthesis protein FlhA [Candidatus Atribacteria bacterium]|nr:flagellar biosynthesis protein FlhA [Candidatus Atribacteria bacterium]